MRRPFFSSAPHLDGLFGLISDIVSCVPQLRNAQSVTFMIADYYYVLRTIAKFKNGDHIVYPKQAAVIQGANIKTRGEAAQNWIVLGTCSSIDARIKFPKFQASKPPRPFTILARPGLVSDGAATDQPQAV